MGATGCLAPRPPTTKLFRPTSIKGDSQVAGAGYWSSNRERRERRDRGMEALCSSSGVALPMAVLDFRALPRGLGGSKLGQTVRGRVLSSSGSGRSRGRRRKVIGGRWLAKGETGVGSHLEDGGLGGRRGRCRQWRVRVSEDAEQDPLEREDDALEKEWEGLVEQELDLAEGEQEVDELEDTDDMLELIEAAEKLRRAKAADGGPGELPPEDIERRRAEKLREELARIAKQQAEQRKQAEAMLGLGQRAYGSGAYDRSVAFLEGALSNVPRGSNLGGEIQIWLAMAYDAHNRHGDCIALYKRLEESHPNKQVRRQAADLRYILEAPKLKISKDEMVSIPIIERDYDRNSKSWSQKVRDSRRKPMPKSKSKDYLDDWLVWDPPRWERNPYFWVAVTVWLTLVGVSLMFQD